MTFISTVVAMEGGALSDSPPTLWCFKHSCIKVHMAGTYVAYNLISSYTHSQLLRPLITKLFCIRLLGIGTKPLLIHKVPPTNCNNLRFIQREEVYWDPLKKLKILMSYLTFVSEKASHLVPSATGLQGYSREG